MLFHVESAQLRTRFCVGRGEMVKSNQNPWSVTLVKKESIADLPILP